MKNLRHLLNKYSYKIKPIYLELFNYDYLHQPLSGEESRFLGRGKIINKLRSFIGDSSSRSGAYLVSGFRGMGKTSVVNKALSIYRNHTLYQSYLLAFGFSLFFLFERLRPSFTDLTIVHFIFLLCAAVFLLVASLYQIYSHSGKNDLGNQKGWRRFICFFWRNKVLLFEGLLKNPFRKQRYQFAAALRAFFLLLSYLLGLSLVHIAIECISEPNLFSVFWTNVFYCAVCFVVHDRLDWNMKRSGGLQLKDIKWPIQAAIFFTIAFVTGSFGPTSQPWFTDIPTNLILFNLFSALPILAILIGVKIVISNGDALKARAYEGQLRRFKRFLGLNKILIVKINLGKDILDEKDVLKYTTHSLLEAYQSWRFSLANLGMILKRLLPMLVIYGSLLLLEANSSFKGFTRSMIFEFQIHQILPSQALLKSTPSHDQVALVFSDQTESLSQYVSQINYTANLRGSEDLIIYSKDEYFLTKLLYATDFLVAQTYFHTRTAMFGKKKFTVQIPLVIDYVIVGFLLLLHFLIYWTNLLPFLGMATHRSQILRLKRLKERIDASVSFDKSGSATMTGGRKGILGLNWSFRRKVNFSPMDAKDIEIALSSILDDMARIPFIFTQVKTVFVFDELDKITSHSKTLKPDKEDEALHIDFRVKRQEIITNILSSLKSFLTTAPAKFIFIAGRDMYDAALAGISDRQSILDSIFHDNKIYVNSFFTELEDLAVNDVNSMAERYVCEFLLPEKEKKKSLQIGDRQFLRLSDYHSYLKNLNVGESEIIRIITLLSNLFKYITYRSNGAPKKMSNLLERFIHPVNKNFFVSTDDKIIVGHNTDRLYLRLSYYEQYRLSLVTYISTPIFLKLSNYMNEFGDKILVSISYILDHIFKYHRFGFSSRNLALTPEIIDINKEPEFRNFLNEIVNDLSITQLRQIISGSSEFRFNSKIRNELKYLTKLSPLESAAFNFTLDESIEIKRFFYNRLNQVKGVYQRRDQLAREDYVNSVAFYHMTIGDLHFFDQEYSEAIVNYLEAIQVVNQLKEEEIDIYMLVLMIRNNLKLGLAFEKEGVFKSALMKYSALSDLIMKKRNIELKSLHLARFVIRKSEYEALMPSQKTFLGLPTNLFKDKEEVVVMGRLKTGIPVAGKNWDDLFGIDDLEKYYDTEGEELTKVIEDFHLNYNPHFLHLQLSTIENVRLMYQPIVAKLHLIEKSTPNGVKKLNIKRALQEFEFLTRTIDKTSKNILITEFYNKIGDLLYYKNANKLGTEGIKSGGELALFYYLKGLLNLLPLDLTSQQKLENYHKNRNFQALLKAVNTFLARQHNSIKAQGSSYILALANTIIDIADAVYGMIEDEKLKELPKLYDQAAELLAHIGKYRLAKSQKIKQILIYISNAEHFAKDFKEVEKLCSQCEQLIQLTYGTVLLKEKAGFEAPYWSSTSLVEGLEGAFLQQDIEEIKILKLYSQWNYEENAGKKIELTKKAYAYFSKTQPGTRYTRIFQNKLRVSVNKHIMKRGTLEKCLEYLIGYCASHTEEEAKVFFIIDSIACLNEIIKLQGISGANYIATGNLSRAKAHGQMHYWCKELEKVLKESDESAKKEILETIKAFLGTRKLQFLNPDFHLAKADYFNKMADQMHNRGGVYMNFLKANYYLDDDFNDNIVHFGVAKERAEMNKESVRKKKKEIRQEAKRASRYRVKEWF